MAEQTSDKLVAEGQQQLARIRRFNKAVALEKLKEMDPYVFEYLTAALFEQFGYQATAATAGSDEGVDVYLRNGNQLSVVQCKRYDNNIGQPIIRDLYGTMFHNGAEEAYLVTTAQFTRQAEEWAENKPIHLVDGFTLVDWIMSTEDGVSTLSVPPVVTVDSPAPAATGSAEGALGQEFGMSAARHSSPKPLLDAQGGERLSPVGTADPVASPVIPIPVEPYQPVYPDEEPSVMASSATRVESESGSRQKGRGLWFWSLCSLAVILLGFMAGLFYMRQNQVSDSNNGGISESEVGMAEQGDGVVGVLYEGDIEASTRDSTEPTVEVSADEVTLTIEPIATPEPTATPVTVSTATSTSIPVQNATSTPSSTPSSVPVDTSTAEPTLTDSVTVTPEATATPKATEIPENRPTSVPTVTLVATATDQAVRPVRNLAGIYTRPPRQGVITSSSAIQPVLDGELSEWSGDGSRILSVVAGEDRYDGAADLSAVFWSAWSPEGLYLAVRVVDDVYRGGPDGTDMWMGDGLEIHFDGMLEADFADSGVGDDDYQIGISFGADLDEIRAYLWYPYELEGTLVVPGNVKKTDEGYEVEIELPISLFQRVLSQNLLTSNNTFGFNISINDNDSDEVVQETILSWSPARSTYNDPREWGTLLLR